MSQKSEISTSQLHPVILSCIHPFLMDFDKIKYVDGFCNPDYLYIQLNLAKGGDLPFLFKCTYVYVSERMTILVITSPKQLSPGHKLAHIRPWC